MAKIMRPGVKGGFSHFDVLHGYSFPIPNCGQKSGDVLPRSMSERPLEANKLEPYALVYSKNKHPKKMKTPISMANFIWQVSRSRFQ